MTNQKVTDFPLLDEVQGTDVGYAVRPGTPDTDNRYTFEQVLAYVNANTAPPPPAPVYAGNILFVDPAHPDAEDDTDTNTPFETIQAAINESGGNALIRIAPGVYPEDLTIASGGIRLVGISVAGQSGVIIEGQITIGVAGNNFTMRGIEVDQSSTSATDYCVLIDSSAQHRFDECYFKKADPLNTTAVLITGTAGGNVVFRETNLEGDLRSESTGGMNVAIKGMNGQMCRLINAHDTAIMLIKGCQDIGAMVHEGGVMVAENVGVIGKDPLNNRCVLSTAAAGVCAVVNGSCSQYDGTVGLIEIQNAFYGLLGVIREFENDILNGVLIFGTAGWNGQDFMAGYTPSTYSDSLQGTAPLSLHLEAIDQKFEVVDGGEY